MTPDRPSDPQKGKPAEEEQIELEAAEAKAEAKKPRRTRKAAKAEEGSQPVAESAPAKKRRSVKKASVGKASAAPAAEAATTAGKAAEAEAAVAEKAPPAKAPAATKPAAEPTTAPRRRGAGQQAAPRRKVVRAHARYVRTSARKARMVCGHLRGKSVQEARAILAFTPREVARDWSKLLESAVANAESNHELLEDDLIVREAYADEGPTIKRFRPRAMGRATPIRKRTSHLTITLTPSPEPGTTKRR